MANYVQAQITGSVFRDFNANGTKETNEPYVAGVTVTAYNADGSVCGTTTSSNVVSGTNYSLSCTGQIRLEFVMTSNPDACSTTGIDGPVVSGSDVQFLTVAGSATANFPINYPGDYNTGAANTSWFNIQNFSGDPATNANVGNAYFSSYKTYMYNSAQDGAAPNTYTAAAENIGYNNTTGSTWGVAYSKQAADIFVSAIVARHTGLGINGAGAIYKLVPTATSYNITPFFDMNNNAFTPTTRVSADGVAGAPAYGEGTSYFISGPNNNIITYTGATDPLTGQPFGLGVVGTNSERDVSTFMNIPGGYDPAAFDQVGKVGIGDIEMSDDGKYMFVTNLYQRKIFRLTMNDAYNPTSVTAVTAIDIPTSVAIASNGQLRPFGLKYSRGALYIGVAATGENNGGTGSAKSATGGATDQYAYVFEVPNATGTTPTANATPIFAQPLNYNLGYSYTGNVNFPVGGVTMANPWFNNSNLLYNPTDGTLFNPQYMMTGIEFSDRGDLILSMADRRRFQYIQGKGNFKAPDVAGNSLIASMGNMIIAGKDCSGTYAQELNKSIASSNGQTYTGSTTTSGPGGGSFFVMKESTIWRPTQGAVAVLKGQNQVLGTTAGTSLAGVSGQIQHYSTTNGIQGIVQTVHWGEDNGKTRPLGDLELLLPAAPFEIGNRVWNDLDSDGVQDADEIGIDDVTVELYAADGTTLLATTTTANGGQWYFNSTTTTTLKAQTDYVIKVGSSDWTGGSGVSELAGLGLTTTDSDATSNGDARDSDAANVSSVPSITYNTGIGLNNYTLDMGFRVACTPPSAPALSVTNNTCSPVVNGSINVITSCGAGTHIEFSANGGISWSPVAPTYGTSAITVIARCVNDSDANCVSADSPSVTTAPVACPTQPDLSLTKTVDTAISSVGGTVTFTLTLTNDNGVDATGVVVTDYLPVGVTFVSASDPSTTLSGGNIVWNVGTFLGTDAPKTLTITATANAEGSFINNAEITATNEGDDDSTPNNDVTGEDDQDQACFSVPVSLCSDNTAASITVTANTATSYQWYVSTDNGATYTALSGETAQSLVIDNALMGGNGITKYFKVAYNGAMITDSCGDVMCCPIIVTTQTCVVCPPPKCLIITVTKH